MAASKLSEGGAIKYMDLVQLDIKEYNAKQEERRNEFKRIHGEKGYMAAIYGGAIHHPLKSTRTNDYRLTDEEIAKLYRNGFLIKDTTDQTFAGSYLSLYNDDMPVMITSDSMLHAFHRYYDNWLKETEIGSLTKNLKVLCTDIKKCLEILEIKGEEKELLSLIELLVVVPNILLNLEQKLDTDFDSLRYTHVGIAPDKIDLDKYNRIIMAETIQQELESGYVIRDPDACDPYNRKYPEFLNYYKIDRDICGIINRSPKMNTLYMAFKLRHVAAKPILKFSSYEQLDKIIKSIAKHEDIVFSLNGKPILLMDGSMFKPRGHYVESFELENYYMAFTWLSTFTFNLEKIKCGDEWILPFDTFALGTIIAKLLKSEVINEFTKFIEVFMGKPSGYTVPSFLEVVSKHLVPTKLDDFVHYVWKNREELYNKVAPELKYKEVSIVSKSASIDYEILGEMVDDKFVNDRGSKTLRKYPTVLDIVATLFKNKSVEEHMFAESKESYRKHLERVSRMCDGYEFSASIYDHELKMLRALTADQSKMKALGHWPFSENTWGKKLAITQIGHYAELRHDNMLYVKEYCGACCSCEYADLMVEPVPSFWNEFLALVVKMKALTGNWQLDVFEAQTINIIKYLECQLSGKPISRDLENSVRNIIKRAGGSGPGFDGWYYSLTATHAFIPKPEVASIFTGVPDERDPGGIIHIGTGNVRLMYVLSRTPDSQTKVFLGPVYSSYEVKTPYGTRYNDSEWNTESKKLKPFDFSI
ncbi:MAG: hypothetical protein Hyperionvirus16_5 [Hyperionvirus sp.]|uniref:DUF3160 domain-containing protein n=1 Tax=Hyperionvirus sp. TaxID=2487770 RepID=A0A3G5A9V5_9VIRU|nr:MAG: hypothetical protein Hyperionvirus16_5 [Hyperionvirus sp.]